VFEGGNMSCLKEGACRVCVVMLSFFFGFRRLMSLKRINSS
jgi:hypothetical protein